MVCGFLFGPPADEGRIEPISSGSLAAYLLGATLIVLASFHADAAMIVFAILVAGTLFVAWRAPAATGAVAAAAVFVAFVFLEWAVRANPDMLVLPGGPLPGIGPHATDGSVSLHLTTAAIFAVGFGVAGFLAQGRSVSAIIPVVWSAAAVFTPLALLIALYARIAHLDRSIPFAILAVMLAAAYGAATEILTKRDNRPGLAISIALFATGTLGALALALTFALEKGWLTIALALMSMGTAWISMQRPIPFLRSLAAILAAHRGAAHRLRAAHRRRRGRHHADLQLAAVGLRHSGAVVLGRQHFPAPPRRRRAAAHGGIGGDPVHGAAGVHGNPPCREWRRCLSRHRRPHRDRAAGLRRAGDGDRPGAVADSHRQRRPQCQRGPADGVCRIGIVVGLLFLDNPACSGRSTSAAHSSTCCCSAMRCRPCSRCCCPMRWRAGEPPAYANTIAAGALVLALSYVTLEIRRLYHGPDLDQRRHRRRRAIHLFDRLAGVRRGAARHRHILQFAARPARIRRRDRADDPEGVPDRHVDADGRLPRAVVHVPRPGAGGDRLAVPADPVPQAGCGTLTRRSRSPQQSFRKSRWLP